MLGERLFPKVKAVNPSLAGKITGMLLEMDSDRVIELLGNQSALHSKIHEAECVLHQNAGKRADTPPPPPLLSDGRKLGKEVSSLRNIAMMRTVSENDKVMSLQNEVMELERALELSKECSLEWERKYDEVRFSKESAERSVERMKEQLRAQERELGQWHGDANQLRTMDVAKLHEFELRLIRTLEKVRVVANQRYEKDTECRICMGWQKDVVLVPCGHCMCSRCANRIQKCPMCRARIHRRVKMK